MPCVEPFQAESVAWGTACSVAIIVRIETGSRIKKARPAVLQNCHHSHSEARHPAQLRSEVEIASSGAWQLQMDVQHSRHAIDLLPATLYIV